MSKPPRQDQAKKSSKRIPSANLTAGKGFSFETQVGAWFLIHMLAGISPFDDDFGLLQQLAFQTEPYGWLLDDLLLTCKKGNDTHRYAISIKSDRQFTAQKAPKDFVDRCWLQFLNPTDNPFTPEADRLVNITAELPTSTRDSISSLLKAARVRNPAEMTKQLANGDLSKNARTLFQSFACPKELAVKYQVETGRTPELLRCISVIPINLEAPNSTDKTHALSLCQQVLDTNESQKAIDLWNELISLVDRYRVDRGHIDLPVVLRALRHRFLLKEYPDYSADWNRLWADSKERWQSVINIIGGKTRFPRTELLQEIEAKFDSHCVVALLGDQGSGKSVAARCWAEHRSQNEPVLWLDSRIFEVGHLSELREKLKINHPWQELIQGFSHPRMAMILDGLDHLLLRPESIKVLGQLLAALLENRHDNSFQILLTCQEQSWRDVQIALLQAHLNVTAWPDITIQPINSDELSIFFTDFPILRSLFAQERLIPILCQPKVLDLIARSASIDKLPNLRAKAGESDIIDWIWQAQIIKKDRGNARQKLMWQLADKQAQRLSIEIPLDELSDIDDAALDYLEKDQICQNKNGKVSFSHDLWGDWARQRLLLAHESELPKYIESRLDNPIWHRSTVLLGLDLLERQAKLDRWRELMEQSLASIDGRLFCDLFLESLIRAAQTTDALDQTWSQLCANEGVWLRRLLIRFLHVATSPNPLMLEYGKSNKGMTETWAASIYRIPRPELWVTMLRFLRLHCKECIDLAPLQIAEIAECWLRWTPSNMPLRNETADLALAVAWQALCYQQHWRFRDYPNEEYSRGHSESIIEKAYAAALLAVEERPDEVIDFALCACGRRKPTDPPLPELKPDEQEFPEWFIPETTIFSWQSEINVPAWPDGPHWKVDDKFRKICLHQSGLFKLIELQPNKAAEIILALIIREGGIRFPASDYRRSSHHFELTDDFQWPTPFYNRGCFLELLTAHPTIGLEVIIKLVNFVTDRWLELQKWREANESKNEWLLTDKQIFDVRISFDGGEQIWIGDGGWFFAYRDSTEAPSIVVSALMALEKWLYDLMEQNQDIETIFSETLTKTRSLAMAGVLIGVGKKQPKLFLGCLKPFLSVIEIYRFDLAHSISGEGYQMIGWSGWQHSQKEIEVAREWHSLPHRENPLELIVIELLLKDLKFRDYFDAVREKWGQCLNDDLLFRLFHQFNLKNYHLQQDIENNRMLLHFIEPKEMLEKNSIEKQIFEDRMAIKQLPFQCRQIIEGKKTLSESEFEQLWERRDHLFNSFDEIFGEPERIKKEDISSGLIAAAICRFRNWLNSKEEQELDCLNILIEIVKNPPSRNDFDVTSSIIDTQWDSFCADALPILWVDHQSDLELRYAIGALVFSFHYHAVKQLFKQITLVRDRIGDDYFRLHHLLLRWAILRYQLNNRFSEPESSHRQKLIDESHKMLQQFVDGSLSPNIPGWKTLDPVFHDPQSIQAEKYYPRSPSIDLELMSLAYKCAISFDSEIERSCWFDFGVQAVESLSWMLGIANPDIKEIDGRPNEFDRWLFQKLPLIIVSAPNEYEVERIWRPILELGSPAHYWVEAFLKAWWAYGFSRDSEKQQRFISIWKQMWSFIQTSPVWSDKSKRYWRLSESFCALMGLDEITLNYDFWNADRGFLVKTMAKEFELWCEARLFDVSCAQAFIKFLTKPAATSLQFSGLLWLDKTIEKHGFWRDSHKDIDTSLAELLDHHQKLIGKDIDTRRVFFRLLRVLIERQHPQAMALHDRLGN